MRAQRNLRLSTAGALLALCLSTAPAWADYLSDGRAAMDKGDLKTAQIQLRNAVRNAPDSGEARGRLARVDLALGDAVAAEKEARAARDLNYDPPGMTALLADAYFSQGKVAAVLTDFNKAGKDKGVDSAALIARGLALASQRKPDDADAAFKEAETLAPQSPQPLLAQAKMAILRNDVPAATALTDRALALDAKSPEARIQKAALLRQANDPDGALTLLNGVLTDQPGLMAARLDRASLLISQKQPEKAREDVDIVLATVPGSIVGAFLRADLQANAKDWQGADATLTKLGERVGNVPRGYLLQALVKQQLGQAEQAEDAARRAVAREPNDIEAVKLLARLQLARREPDKAIATLGPLSKSDRADAETEDLIASAYAGIGSGTEAITALQKAVALQPDNVALLTQLGRVKMATGDGDGAMADLTKALTMAPDQPQTAEQLYFAALSTGDLDRAAAVVKLAHDKLGADSPVAGNLDGLFKLAKLDTVGARASFDQVVKAHPDFVPAQINLARLDAIEGHGDETINRLNAILAKAPAGEPALTMTVTRLIAMDKPDDAAAVLARARTAAPDDVRVIGRQAAFALQRNDPKKALSLMPAADKTDNVALLGLIAQAQLADNQKDAARDTLTKLVQTDPSQIEQRRRLAALQLDAGQAEIARNTIQAGMALTPQNLALLEDYATIDVRSKGLEAGLATADTLQTQARDFVPARAIKGDLLMQAQKYDDAIAAYRAALTAAPASVFVLRIADAQQRAGHEDDAVKTLADWVAAHPQDDAPAQVLSSLYIKRHDYPAAAKTLEAMVAATPRNGVTLNNLAWVYQQIGDKRAQDTARRAYTLAPGAQTADTLGWILTTQGDPKQGITLLRQAAGDAANDPRLQYHLAVALKDTGKRDEAKQVLQTIVAKKQEFEEKDSAEKLLAELSKA